MTKWFSYKLSNLELWCLLTSYRKSYKEPIIDPLKSKMAILTPKCKNAVFSKTKYYPNRTTLSRKMTSCRFSRRQISAILDFRDPIALNLLHPAIRQSWHWFRQVTAPCNMACGSGIMTVNSPSGSTLQCGRCLRDDMPWNSPKTPDLSHLGF